MNIEDIERRHYANEGLKADVQTQQLYEALDSLQDEKDFLKTMLDSSQVIIEIENLLRGRIQVFNETKNVMEWRQITKPLLNDEGINYCLQTLLIYTHKSQVLTNSSDDEVNQEMGHMILTIIPEIAANSVAFGLDELRRDSVVAALLELAKAHKKRSIGRAEGKDAYGRTKGIEHIQKTLGQKEDSGWFPWGGK